MANIGSGALKRARSGKRVDWLHQIDVPDMLERLEVLNIHRATSDEYLFSCPFPGHSSGDSKPSAYMNDGSKDPKAATVWKCHGCGRAGNAITFFAEHEGITKADAAFQLRETYAPNFRPPKGGKISIEFESRLNKLEDPDSAPEEQPIIPDELYQRLFEVDWESALELWLGQKNPPPEIAYMLDRGFSIDTLAEWMIGFDERSQRFTIPVHNELGQIVGVKGRTYKPKEQERIKYKILGDKEGRRKQYGFAPYKKALVVFGAHKAKESRSVVLCEGELDVVALWQVNIPAISTGSAALSDTQSRIIRDHFDEVVVFFDSNTAGQNATWGHQNKDGEWKSGLVDKLEPFLKVKVVPDHEKDAADYVAQNQVKELRQLLSEAQSSYRLRLDENLL